MRVADVIRARKVNVRSERWENGKIPAPAWLFRASQDPKRHPKSWQWRIIHFEALGREFRVLIELLEAKQMCSITLGALEGGLIRTVCVHEVQAGKEPGWHCHAVYRCSQGITAWAHHNIRRYPKRPSPADGTTALGLDRSSAMRAAVRFFRLDNPGASGNLL